MSVVIGCICKEKIIIMGDKRAVDVSTLESIDENFEKVARISDSIVIGFTGNYWAGKMLVEIIKQYAPKEYLQDVHLMKKLICDNIGMAVNKSGVWDIPLNIILGGKDRLGKLSLILISSENGECISQSVSDENIGYNLLANKQSYGEILRKNFADFDVTLSNHANIFEAIEQTVKDIAKVDCTVNDQICYEEIRCDH